MSTITAGGCVFCEIIVGRAPATFVEKDLDGAVIFRPLHPVTDGHVLIVPTAHVADAATSPGVTATTAMHAAKYAATQGRPFNLITSAGSAATQTVFHLHLHYVPRTSEDGLALPWTPNPASDRALHARQLVAALDRISQGGEHR